jgi:transcriptional regulator with XRE-family HTH domain
VATLVSPVPTPGPTDALIAFPRVSARARLYIAAVATRRSTATPKLRTTGATGAPRAKAKKAAPKQAVRSRAAKAAAPRRSTGTRAPPAGRQPVPDVADGASGALGKVIANHVRSRRLEIGLNVGQLAERTGISKGMLSKIENAQTSPSLSTVERLSAALDMPLTALFRGLAEERDAVFVKAGSGPEIVRKGTRSGHTYELLGSLRGPYKRIEPLLVSLAERTEVFPLFQHAGIEILYMLDGIMEYSYGREHYRMERGDTLQFEGDIPHGPIKLVKLPIRFLSITFYGSDRS